MSTPHTGLTSTPGRKPMFSRDDAVDTALALGIDRFTMSQVARSLGVTPPAIYRRFPTRNDLLEAAIDRVMSTVPAVDTTDDVDNTLRHFANQWWVLFTRYPGLHRVVNSYERDPTRFFNGVFATHRDHLQTFGLTARQTVFAGDLIVSMLARLRLHSPEGDATTTASMAAERAHRMNFLLAALHTGWPEWGLEYSPAEPSRDTSP